jgi:hypothetical protein
LRPKIEQKDVMAELAQIAALKAAYGTLADVLVEETGAFGMTIRFKHE